MISIIIPNNNGMEHLKICYDSLLKQTYSDYEVIIIDNNSSDDSVRYTTVNYPDFRIIRLNYNSGFAKAVNYGIEEALKNNEAEYITLLNNDTECDRNFLQELINGFKTEDTGSVGCKMLNYYERQKIDSAGDFIKKGGGSPYARGHNETDKGQYDKKEFIFGASAGAVMYKREAFERAGFFDNDFFAYFEDIDFSFRMQLLGYKCYYNPKAICYHKRGSTTKEKIGLQTMYCEKNLIAIRIKNYPIDIYIKYSIFFIAARIRRYYKYIRHHSFKVFLYAVYGYIRGTAEIPKSIKKRMVIQRKRKVSSSYIENLFGEGNKL